MMKKLFVVVLFWNFYLQADVLFTETFDEFGTWPSGWAFDQYVDPATGEVYLYNGQNNWRVDNSYQSEDLNPNFTPPAAVFLYSPRVPLPNDIYIGDGNDPQSALETSYELSLQSPDINVGDNTAVMVEFTFALDYWEDPPSTSHINGMIIEADGGSGWIEMLKYEVGGDGAGNEFDASLRTETFITSIESGVLRIRWKAYGTDSWFIDAWIVDNVKVITLPKLSYVNIQSNNSTDNQSAVEGDEVTLSFTSEQDLLTLPYVQINGSETVVIPQGGNEYFTTYSVNSFDEDGPLTFSIDFTALDGAIDGATVKNTTNNSRVTIDRTAPPAFNVADIIATQGGNVFSGKWNSTNTGLNIDVTVPEDSAVVEFDYFQGNSLAFDGVDDRVVVSENSIYKFSNQFTVEAWIKPNSTSSDNYRGIISFGKDGDSQFGYGFAYYATGWRFFIKTQSYSVSQWTSLPYASAPAGQWTHLAATYDGSKLRLYKNGSLVEEKNISGSIVWPDDPGPLYIGSFNKGETDYYFSGNIDEVRFWNISRSGSQIKGNKGIALEGNENGLVGYWKADESSGLNLSDETINQADGTLNGASFITLNSPINFSSPVYDNTVIIGSNYKLRAKIGTSEFETFDSFQDITLVDFNTNQKNISGTSINFSNVAGYQHGENALISAVLYDQSGNQSLGDTSAMVLEIDLIANDPTSVNIISNNPNSSYAKTGDIVTITMSYDENINSTSSLIENNIATVTNLGNDQFKADYTLSGSEPEGILDFVIDASDYMGNPGSYSLTTDASQVIYDKTPPELDYVNIASNNLDTAWAKINDSIEIKFKSNEIISLQSNPTQDHSILFDGQNDYVKLPENIVSSCSDFTFICSFKTNNNNGWARLMDFGSGTGINMFLTTSHSGTNKPRFAIKAAGGSEQQLTATVALNQGQWYNIAFTIDNSISTGKLYIDGELIAENNSMTYTPSDLDNTCCNYFGKSQYNDPYLDGYLDDISMWSVPLTQSQIQEFMSVNPTGNEPNLEGYWNFNEGEGSTANDLSGNGIDGTLINMDEESSWIDESNNRLSLIPSVIIMGQTADVLDRQNNNFSASYIAQNSDIEGDVAFEIQFSDLAGNVGIPVTISTNNTKVIFDKTPPIDFTVGLLTPTGGNQVDGMWNLTNTGMDIVIPVANDTTLRNGTVQLYGSIGLNDYEVFGSISTILSNEINSNKTISVSAELIEGLTGFAEGERIYIKAVMSDRPGNITEGSQSITEILIDETPASITPISIFSNNNNTALAKVGDTVSVSFLTSENLIDTVATISGQNAIITGLGSNQFVAVYVMGGGDSEGVIEFEISFIDAQGNPLTGTDSTTDASQVVFDKTKPTLDPITVISDNLCSSGSIAKAENIVTINFTSLEPLLSTFAIVMSDTVSVINEGSYNYSIDYRLTSEDTEGDVSFLIQVTDLSGNMSDDIINTTDGSNVNLDQTLPILDYVHIESNNSYSSIAVLGDIVTLTFEPTEPLSSADVVMSGTSVSVTESGGVYSATYTIQDSDMLTGGFLPFTIDFTDCPGNIGLIDSTTSDESFVSIDIGPPEMVSVKIFSSNQDSSWAKVGDSVFVYFVVNEPLKIVGSPADAVAPFSSLKIGENSVEVSNVPNTTTYKGFYIMDESDIEGTVPLEILFYDFGSQAGNNGSPVQTTTDESTVIFDKTKPRITQASFLSNNIYGDSLAKVNDVGTISFGLNEELRSISIIVDGDSIIMNGADQNFSYNYSFSYSNDNGRILLSMVALDSASNQADTIIDKIYFDKTAPQLSAIFEGSISEDKVYSKHEDSLQLSWQKVELESGLKRAYIGLGSDSGLVDIVNWTIASGDDESSLTSINLQNNSKYYGSIFLEDNVGNVSDSLWGNGITIDLVPPVVGDVWDGFLDEDIDYTADSTQLFMRWKNFIDNQSIDYYETAIGTNNDTINIANWQRSDFLDNMQIQGLDLDRDVRYFAYLRAIDSATNVSAVIKSDGVEFDNTAPDIKSIYPLFDSLQVLSVLNNDQIKIGFNKPILKFGFRVSASQDTNLNYSSTIQDSGIVISILDILPSYETITVNIDTAFAFNLLNYTDTIIFKTKLWGDLNGDYKISVEDVLAFNQGWLQSETDLGPISGSPPYLFPTPDNQFELNDLVAFGKMWIWYYHEYQADSLFVFNHSQNDDVKIDWEGDKLSLSIPDSSHGAEITFFDSNFDINGIFISNLKSSTFSFTAIDSNYNSTSFIIADRNSLGPKISFKLKDRSIKIISSSMKYKFIDSVSTEISNGVEKINVEVLPQKFSLFQNYPNPFNNETTIKYKILLTSDIVIKIYDIVGREIFSKSFYDQNPGVKHFKWEGHDNKSELVSSGVYFFQISDGENVRKMKMILLK